MGITMRPNAPKPRYIPKGMTKISDKQSDAVAYVQSRVNTATGTTQWYGMVFYAEQSKPVANYRFRNEAEMQKTVAEYFKTRQESLAYKNKRSAERKAFVNPYKIGDIVNTCWGYDQTNREYYEVVGINKKHVTLRRIATTSYATGHMTQNVTPLPGDYIGESFTRLAQKNGIKIGQYSFTYASLTSFRESVPGVKEYAIQHTSNTH
jgi:aldehyde:ferredoxin oxidoreductase